MTDTKIRPPKLRTQRKPKEPPMTTHPEEDEYIKDGNLGPRFEMTAANKKIRDALDKKLSDLGAVKEGRLPCQGPWPD